MTVVKNLPFWFFFVLFTKIKKFKLTFKYPKFEFEFEIIILNILNRSINFFWVSKHRIMKHHYMLLHVMVMLKLLNNYVNVVPISMPLMRFVYIFLINHLFTNQWWLIDESQIDRWWWSVMMFIVLFYCVDDPYHQNLQYT